jgi:hypothetical protein
MGETKKYYLIVLLVSFCMQFIWLPFATAQKLPKTQNGSLMAPDNVKIDGNLAEWGKNNIKAYNSINRISYSVANDDKNLYLIVVAPESYEIEKIVRGGLIFTISHSLDRKERVTDKTNTSMRFPVAKFVTYINISENKKHFLDYKKDTVANRLSIDTLANQLNNTITDEFKEIEVTGINEILDKKIAVYNSYQIYAMAQFDRNMRFSLEFAIPLKYLGLSVNNGAKFSYGIKLPGPPAPVNSNPNAPPPPMVVSNDGNPNFDYEYVNNATELWGEYMLVNKK